MIKRFASDLHMRWPWHERNDETKPWIGMGNPFNPQDKELFAAAIKGYYRGWKESLFLGGDLARGMSAKRHCAYHI
jgi:hypothetical protein